MYRILVVCIMSAVCSGASAGSIYKCVSGGKTSYTDRPCDYASVTPIDIATVPAADPEVAARLARQKQILDGMVKERTAAEQRSYRAQLSAERAEMAQRQRCQKMDSARRRAGEAAESAMGARKQKLREKAYQLRQEYAVLCPG